MVRDAAAEIRREERVGGEGGWAMSRRFTVLGFSKKGRRFVELLTILYRITEITDLRR